ncbi:excalibur calcium-binding domain-containing protein [Sphingomonas sp. KR3-1]|uniref:excalibur calcium-binding domain-containing protein n=1 Tax=Sphingomonas sp. KR3-1 TaxID=3156611 RepID=UPI0032B3C1DA
MQRSPSVRRTPGRRRHAPRRRESGGSFLRTLVSLSLITGAATWILEPDLESLWTQLTLSPEALKAREATVFYAGCDEARAAGVAPIRRGEPGYREGMDGDGDGLACEPYR